MRGAAGSGGVGGAVIGGVGAMNCEAGLTGSTTGAGVFENSSIVWLLVVKDTQAMTAQAPHCFQAQMVLFFSVCIAACVKNDVLFFMFKRDVDLGDGHVFVKSGDDLL